MMGCQSYKITRLFVKLRMNSSPKTKESGSNKNHLLSINFLKIKRSSVALGLVNHLSRLLMIRKI